MGPPNPQTALDRDYLKSLFYLFEDLPQDFEFPLLVDQNYVPPSNSLYCFVIGAVTCAITVPIVFLRLWVRYNTGFGMDDWMMVPAVISYCIFSAINAVAVWGTGMGYHLYDLSRKDIYNFIIIKYIHVDFWFSILHFCRLSILHLLLRLTPVQLTLHRRYILSVIWISWLYMLLCLAAHTFECGLPLRMSFELQSSLDGTCIGAKSLSLYGGLIVGHILLDFFTILPPLIILWALPMPGTKKLNLVLLLVLGAFTVVCSLVRIFYFYQIMISSFDITWNGTDVAFWSMFECGLACIIACLPALNHLIIKFLKKFKTRGTSKEHQPPKNEHGIIRLPVKPPKIYQSPVISNGYGRFMKRWANTSRTGSKSSGDISVRCTLGPGSSTTSSINPSTNNSSVLEIAVYTMNDNLSDVEEEAVDLNDIYIAGLGSAKASHPDRITCSSSASVHTDASQNV